MNLSRKSKADIIVPAISSLPIKDEAYYLRGNAYRKQGNWQQALNNYQYAIDLNPESPAQHASVII